MNVLVIYGSPRTAGNTSVLLDAFVDSFLEHADKNTTTPDAPNVERLVVRRLDIRPCLGCDACLRGPCIQDDDMQALYPKLASADIIVVGAPVYFYGLPAKLKALVDRCQLFFNKKYVKKEKWRKTPGRGYFVSCGATNGAQLFQGSVLTVKYWFDALDMEYSGDALIRGVDAMGDARKHPTAFEDVRLLAKAAAAIKRGPQ